MRPVGVLGGMGPEATILFQQRLLARIGARDDADHVPLLIDMNPQVPSRIAHLLDGTGNDPAPVLAAMARRLESAGATALAMPCNTAHAYADAIRGAVSIPLIDMPRLAGEVVRGPVGMLASPVMRRIGLWERVLAGPVHWPADDSAMLDAIRAIKRGDTGRARPVLDAAADELRAAGAGTLLVGCSEFSIAAAPGPDVIDTLDLLTDATLRHARGEG